MTAAVLVVAATVVLAAVSLGVASAAGRVPARWRWVHHALYGAALLAALVALVLLTVRTEVAATPTAVAVVALVRLTRTRGGSRDHVATASVAAGAIGVALVVGV